MSTTEPFDLRACVETLEKVPVTSSAYDRALAALIARPDELERAEARMDFEAFYVLKKRLLKAIERVLKGGSSAHIEAAVIALKVSAGELSAVDFMHRLFHQTKPSEGFGSRLWARMTNEVAPSREHLIAQLSGTPMVNLLASEMLAERGVEVVEPLRELLRELPRKNMEWMARESLRYHVLGVFERLGPLAMAAAPEVLALVDDYDAYRDTRWIAGKALEAMCMTSVDALCAMLDRAPSGFALAALAKKPREVLASSEGLVSRLGTMLGSGQTHLQTHSARVCARMGEAARGALPAIIATVEKKRCNRQVFYHSLSALLAMGPSGAAALDALIVRSSAWRRRRIALFTAEITRDRAEEDAS